MSPEQEAIVKDSLEEDIELTPENTGWIDFHPKKRIRNKNGKILPGKEDFEKDKYDEVLAWARELEDEINKVAPEGDEPKSNALPSCPESDDLWVESSNLVLRDLVGQGWQVKVEEEKIQILPPGSDSQDLVREGHLLHRDTVLKGDSVREFINRMETRDLRENADGWTSIFNLMRDGGELADSLEEINKIEDESKRLEELNKTVQPYIQIARSGRKCSETGFDLQEVWRYFRYTWINEHLSSPGRQINVLIRDRAVKHHPVIGIAAFSSPVIAQKTRDQAIGWDNDKLIETILEDGSDRWPDLLVAALDEEFEKIYKNDLIADGLFGPLALRFPSEDWIEKLAEEQERCMEAHYAFERDWRKMPVHDRPTHVSKQPWDERVRSYLFRAKRCRVLKELLIVKKAFLDSGYSSAEEGERGKKFRVAMSEKKFRHSLLKLLQRMKSERVGINILEISVCGAIAPYNKLLGGKLVCMLMSSPQVQEFYRELYGQGESEIASSLKGEAVIKEPHLVGLSTMSLFSYKRKKGMKRKFPGGQYDHVRVPIYVSFKATEFLKSFNKIIGKSKNLQRRLDGSLDRFQIKRGRGGTPLDFDAVAKLQSKLNELKNREKLEEADQELVQKALDWLDDAIEYEDVGESSGWGSYHFSLKTIQKIRELAEVLGIRTVNSIFGEGISPKLRQMSQALSEMNLPPDELLQHRRIRTVYLVRLAKNFSDFCLGFDKEPIPKITAKGNSEIITSEFARYWIWRWLSKRAKRSQTLDAIREDVSTRMPVRHGARVPMPKDDREDDLFPDL